MDDDKKTPTNYDEPSPANRPRVQFAVGGGESPQFGRRSAD
uniref:Uncharacterized protein n=1 Tax=Plectus sambesii TaxID=2011161 RepID=A0A914V958_9BILA